jgi:pyrimidine-nucleoside phosphorylase
VAACGVPVGKMSGRGLGFSGGTIDKLESFPGIRLDLTAHEFVRQLKECGLVISGQSADLAPADGKLYALRDVTGTVPSLPLIASSIMSKKLAAGAHTIVLDVKTGSGAFMRDPALARELAAAMVRIGSAAGRKMAAVVSDMSQPLGRAVGNALEVREALDTLAGQGPPELSQFAVELASTIVDLTTNAQMGRPDVESALASGAAREALRRMVQAQGGDTSAFDDPRRLPGAAIQEPLLAQHQGYLARLDALTIARASNLLGAGRERKGDPIDLAVGVVLHTRLGERIEPGQPLLTIHANDARRLDDARRLLETGIAVSATPFESPPLILGRVPAAG